MTISEPTTLVTDYALGTLSAVLASRLGHRNRILNQVSIGRWAMALAAAAGASFVGGTYHGFTILLTPPAATVLWKLTTISMGVASFLFLAASFSAAFQGRARRWLTSAAAVKLFAYAAWMVEHDDFRFVIYEYGSTLVVLLSLVAARRTNGSSGHHGYIASGVFVSIAAAAVQQGGIRLHQHFNHNDLMHVVQMGGVWLFFQGGLRLRDHEARRHDDSKAQRYEGTNA